MLPPWKGGMPGLLRFLMLFGFAWGGCALATAAFPAGAAQLVQPNVAAEPHGRLAMALGAVLGVGQSLAILRRCRSGPYLLCGFYLYFLVLVWVYTGTPGSTPLWLGLVCLYAWYTRRWFTGRPAQ